MKKNDKSVLDDVPVSNTAFPSSDDYDGRPMEVVGHCSVCGNPVYGRKEIRQMEFPVTRRTCRCLYEGKTLQEKMRTS